MYMIKDLSDEGLYNANNKIQVECLKFCFMDVIRYDLQRLARHWNTHKIRPVRNTESPNGKPDILFFFFCKCLGQWTINVSLTLMILDLDVAKECVRELQLRGFATNDGAS